MASLPPHLLQTCLSGEMQLTWPTSTRSPPKWLTNSKIFSPNLFLLRKWNSNDPAVLQHTPPELKDSQTMHTITDVETYTKTLGIEWNTNLDHFRLTIADLPPLTNVTKRLLVSDIAKTFDVLGWFSPAIVKVKILLQYLWELKVDWDDPVPQLIKDVWLQWRSELHYLSEKHISQCYFPKGVVIESTQLHGFSDASEDAYAGVIYLRLIDSDGNVHISLFTAKTKVAPIKRLTIPHLELCGAHRPTRSTLNMSKKSFISPSEIFTPGLIAPSFSTEAFQDVCRQQSILYRRAHSTR